MNIQYYVNQKKIVGDAMQWQLNSYYVIIKSYGNMFEPLFKLLGSNNEWWLHNWSYVC